MLSLHEASLAIKFIIKPGRKIMFVATKKQIRNCVKKEALKLNMPYVTERWLGRMLTNFLTIRKSLKKMFSIDKIMKEFSYRNLAKKEKLVLSREKSKLNVLL